MDAMGNLYVASWWSGDASVYVGPQVGFVTRISPLTATHRDFPALDKERLSDLIDLLREERSVVRSHAQSELIGRGDAASVSALATAAEDRDFPLNGRIAAMFAVCQIDGAGSQTWLLALAEDPAMREFAVRAITDRKSQLGELKADELVPFLADPSPRVVAQTLIAPGRMGDGAVADFVTPLAIQAGDTRPDPASPHSAQVIPHLALWTLIELNAVDACLKALVNTEESHTQAALRALRHMHTRNAVEGLIARLLIERNTRHNNSSSISHRGSLVTASVDSIQGSIEPSGCPAQFCSLPWPPSWERSNCCSQRAQKLNPTLGDESALLPLLKISDFESNGMIDGTLHSMLPSL